MNQNHHQRLSDEIKKFSALFLERESNRDALISVTGLDLSDDEANATLHISVLPADKEDASLWFVKRNLGEMRAYLMKNIKVRHIPYLDVLIDKGEKNRQKIDELLLGDK